MKFSKEEIAYRMKCLYTPSHKKYKMKTEEWNEIPAHKPDPLYFAKYLPVAGEIKEGDKAIDENIKSKSNVVTITFNKHGIASDGRGTYSDAGLKKLKKVKLFLCSRDNMKVGDKIRMTDNPFVEVEWTEHLDFSKSNTFTGSAPDAFKVIGEISPEATWVTENMEFDQEQLQAMFIHDTEPREFKPTVNTRHISYIVIQCPTCKKFH